MHISEEGGDRSWRGLLVIRLSNLGCLSNTAGIIELRRIGGCGKFGPKFDNGVKSEREAVDCKDIN